MVETGFDPAGLLSTPFGPLFPGRLSRNGFRFGESKNRPTPPLITKSPLPLGWNANPTRGEKLFLSGGKIELISSPWNTRPPLLGTKTERSFFELWNGPR